MGERFQRYVTLLFLFLIVLTVAMPNVGMSDGAPMVPKEMHSSLRENRQLAYIRMIEGYQVMDLFINVASLEPHQNVTILIPLRTRPEVVLGENMTDREFRQGHEIPEIKDKLHKQHNAAGEIAEKLKYPAGTLAWNALGGLGLCGGLGLLYVWASSFASGSADDWSHFRFEGMTVDLRTYNDTSKVGEFYSDLGLDAPESVTRTISKYGNHSFALVNITTEWPVQDGAGWYGRHGQWEEWENATETRKMIMDYVNDHPVTDFYDGYYVDWDRELQDIREMFELETGTDYVSSDEINTVLRAAYGLGTVNGYRLRFLLPLQKGKAYFPLGTSMAWEGQGQVEVIFECPDDMELDLNEDSDQAYMDDNRYYIFNYDGERPDHDLVGEYRKEKLGSKWDQFKANVNEVAYDGSFVIAFVLVYSLYVPLIYRIVLHLFKRYEIYPKNRKHRAIKTTAQLILLGYLIPIWILLLWKASKWKRMRYNMERNRYIRKWYSGEYPEYVELYQREERRAKREGRTTFVPPPGPLFGPRPRRVYQAPLKEQLARYWDHREILFVLSATALGSIILATVHIVVELNSISYLALPLTVAFIALATIARARERIYPGKRRNADGAEILIYCMLFIAGIAVMWLILFFGWHEWMPNFVALLVPTWITFTAYEIMTYYNVIDLLKKERRVDWR